MERIYGSNEFQGQSSRPAQQQQNRRPPRSGQNHFPPPSAVPSYAGRDLPPLPPKSASSSSSVYNSDGSCRATPSRFHRHESPLFMFSGGGSRAESRGSGAEEETGFGGSVNEDGMAMIRPPGMSIVTHFGEQQQQQQQHTVILSPRPRHPDHKIVKDLEQNDGGFVDVSPILSPPTGTFSYQAHEVSPLTPEDSSSFRSFGQHTVSEVDHHEADGQKKQYQHNQQHWATTGDGGAVDSGGSRRQSRWEDIPPAASHSSLGFHPISTTEETNKTRMMATGITNNTSKTHNHRHYQPQFRHSDPGSPLAETSASSTVNHSVVGGGGKVQRAFMLAAPKPYLQASSARRANPQEPRPRSENNYIKFDTKPTTTTAPPAVTNTTAADHDDEEEIITSPYSLWTKGYGATAANTKSSSKQQSTTSPAPSGTSSSRNVSFAVKETPAFSKRTRAGSKPKPVPLHLHGGSKGALDDHVKTPYPEGGQKQQHQQSITTTMVSSWDYDDDDEQVSKDNFKPKRTSWGRGVDRKNNGGGSSKGGLGPIEGGGGGATNSNGGGSGSKSRAMGKKLVSRVRNAGEDVMSRFSFSSEEAKREKRVEELRGKIQHHDPRRLRANEDAEDHETQTPLLSTITPQKYPNIDRLTAIWQTLHPKPWWTTITDQPPANSNLTPFHHEFESSSKKGVHYFDSDDLCNWKQFGYQYDDLEQWKGESDDDYIARITVHVQTTYPSTSHLMRRDHSNLLGEQHDDTYVDFIIDVLYDRYALNGNPYSIHFFLGDIASSEIASTANLETHPNHVGSVYNFSTPLERSEAGQPSTCESCVQQKNAGKLSLAQVPLTIPRYHEASNKSNEEINHLDPSEVEMYLAHQLNWIAVSTSGEEIPWERLDETKVYVLKGEAQHFDEDAVLSNYGNYVPLYGAIEGKPAGASHVDYNF